MLVRKMEEDCLACQLIDLRVMDQKRLRTADLKQKLLTDSRQSYR